MPRSGAWRASRPLQRCAVALRIGVDHEGRRVVRLRHRLQGQTELGGLVASHILLPGLPGLAPPLYDRLTMRLLLRRTMTPLDPLRTRSEMRYLKVGSCPLHVGLMWQPLALVPPAMGACTYF